MATDDERRALLQAKLQDEDHHLTKAILAAFRQTDVDELERLTGDRTIGLARLAAAAAWIEQKRGELPNEDARRHREAQHRAALSIVDRHRAEWAELIRTHRAEIDAERDNVPTGEPPPVTAPPQQTGRERRGLFGRIKDGRGGP